MPISAFISEIDGWMHKIFLANRNFQVYNEKFLLSFWCGRLFGTGMIVNNLKKWKMLMNSYYLKYDKISLPFKIKLFIKCLIRWKGNNYLNNLNR